MSNKKEAHIDDIKSERVRAFDEKADDMYMDWKKQHMNCGVWRKDGNRQINREPPDRDRNKDPKFGDPIVTHIFFVPTSSGSERDEEDTKLLETKVRILKLEHDQRDNVSETSLTERHSLENMITKLWEALVLEQEKNMTLELELNEIHRNIRMLNNDP